MPLERSFLCNTIANFYSILFGINCDIALKIESHLLFGAGSGAGIIFLNFK